MEHLLAPRGEELGDEAPMAAPPDVTPTPKRRNPALDRPDEVSTELFEALLAQAREDAQTAVGLTDGLAK